MVVQTTGATSLITPPYGSPITMTFDTMGRLTSRTRGSITTTYQYYADGKINIIRLPDARTITYTYTLTGKLETIADSLNNRITYTYDSQDNRIKQEIHDPDNVLQYFVEYTYEDTGEVDNIIQADGTFEDMNYDSVGNLVTRINALNKSTEYRYDALNRLTAVVEPGVITTGYDYDSNDNLVAVTDAESKKTVFTYDDFGRKTSRMSPDTGLTIFVYDSADNLITSTDSNNITTTYEYDALNRLTAVHYPDSNRDVFYGYDENDDTGLLTSMQDATGRTAYSYDQLGRVTFVTRLQGAATISLVYGYNANNEIISITYPSGRIISYIRNTTGQITSITSTLQAITTNITDNITYKPFGPRKNMTLGNGIFVEKTFNQLYRMTSTTADTLYDRAYQYSATGHIQSITDGIDPASSQFFSYDDLGRLNTAQGKYGTYNWSYDNVGNRISQVHDTDRIDYVYATLPAPSNRLEQFGNGQTTTSYTYDSAGNTLSQGAVQFSWNQAGRLGSATVNATLAGLYGYDGNGLRTKHTANSRTMYSVYDLAGNLVAKYDGLGTIEQEFVYLDNTRIAAFTLTLPDTFTVGVTDATGAPVAGALATPVNVTDMENDPSATTNNQGLAVFKRSDFGPGDYRFQIRYADINTSSPVIDVSRQSYLQVQLETTLSPVTITVMTGGVARAGAAVSVFSTSGAYLGLQGVTDAAGRVTIKLPVGGSYMFKVLHRGAFYWSTVLTVPTGGTTVTVDETHPAGHLLSPSVFSLLLGDTGTTAAVANSSVQIKTWRQEEPDKRKVIALTAVFPESNADAQSYTDAPDADMFPSSSQEITDPTTSWNNSAQFTVTNPDSAVYYFISDHLSTAQVVVDKNKKIVWQGNFTPFGGVDVVINDMENNFRFPGQYYDAETGLHYNWNRYYDPETGRYITADPIGLEGGMNLYAYVGGNPVNRFDPRGLDNPGCDKFPNSWESPCVLECCASHDECYDRNQCSAGSWCNPTGSDECAECNNDVSSCIILCIGSGKDDPSKPNYYCPRQHRYVRIPGDFPDMASARRACSTDAPPAPTPTFDLPTSP